jgi:hypothetical protein
LDLGRADIHHVEVDGQAVVGQELGQHSRAAADQDHLRGLVLRQQRSQRGKRSTELVGVEGWATHDVWRDHTS